MNILELEGMDPSKAPSAPPETPDLPEIGDSTAHQDILDSIWTVVDGEVDWVEDEQQPKRPSIKFTIRKKKSLGLASNRRKGLTVYTISENGLQCCHSLSKRNCPYC